MKFIIALLSLLMFSVVTAEAKKHILYVGTYTKGVADGIFVYSFSDQTGKLVDMKKPAESNNPSFFTISANKKYLYAVNELADAEPNQSGAVSSFRIEKKGALTPLNKVPTHGAHPAHLCLSPDGKKLVTSNYTGGSISVFNVMPDGTISEMVQRIEHEGSSTFPGRQGEPHAHSAQFDPQGKLLYVADLGIDELVPSHPLRWQRALVHAILFFLPTVILST